jgi:hypothetical protein
MPQNYSGSQNCNSDTTKEIIAAFKLQSSMGVPTGVNGIIQPVVNVNPKDYRNPIILKDATVTDAGGTVYTTRSDVDTYITGIQCSFIKDATATGTKAYATISVNNVVSVLFQVLQLTLTAQYGQEALFYRFPLKVDRGATLVLAQTGYTVGNQKLSIVVYGYTVENINA